MFLPGLLAHNQPAEEPSSSHLKLTITMLVVIRVDEAADTLVSNRQWLSCFSIELSDGSATSVSDAVPPKDVPAAVIRENTLLILASVF